MYCSVNILGYKFTKSPYIYYIHYSTYSFLILYTTVHIPSLYYIHYSTVHIPSLYKVQYMQYTVQQIPRTPSLYTVYDNTYSMSVIKCRILKIPPIYIINIYEYIVNICIYVLYTYIINIYESIVHICVYCIYIYIINIYESIVQVHICIYSMRQKSCPVYMF